MNLHYTQRRLEREGVTTPPRFLFIGCGAIGKRHIRNLLALHAGEILAFDVRPDRQREVETEFGIKPLTSLEVAWKLHPDVVLVTTPTSMHLPMALQAAEHGCHLFIEKPLSDSLQGVGELQDLVRQRDLVTLVGCNMRFHPALVKIKTLIEQGAVGHVAAARVEVGQYLAEWNPAEDYRNTYSARRDLGGGVILDAIHEIDYIRWMLGEVEAVACFAGKLSDLEIDTEDTAAILLRFSSGAIGEVHLDYVQRAYSRTCQIIGEEGTIHWDDTSRGREGESYKGIGEVRWYSATTGKWQTSVDSCWDSNQMYLDEMQHFLRCLVRKEKPALSISEAARVLKVAIAAKSCAETAKVISVSRFRA